MITTTHTYMYMSILNVDETNTDLDRIMTLLDLMSMIWPEMIGLLDEIIYISDLLEAKKQFPIYDGDNERIITTTEMLDRREALENVIIKRFNIFTFYSEN